MILRLFIAFIVIVSVVSGVLNIAPFRSDVLPLAMFSEFFNAALPILAFGALVKYLCACVSRCPCGSKMCADGRLCQCGSKNCKICTPAG